MPDMTASGSNGRRDPARRAARTHACGHPAPREERLQDAGLDPFDLAVLELMRLTFAGMAGNAPRHAPDPAAVADALFAAGRGGPVLAATTALVQAMALSRGPCFHYSNPFCHGCAAVLTQDEGHLIRVLHHLRHGRRGRAVAHALMICDRRPVDLVIDVAADLASMGPLPAAMPPRMV